MSWADVDLILINWNLLFPLNHLSGNNADYPQDCAQRTGITCINCNLLCQDVSGHERMLPTTMDSHADLLNVRKSSRTRRWEARQALWLAPSGLELYVSRIPELYEGTI